MLGKAPAEYCAWITDPDKWGGAIELSILSKWVDGRGQPDAQRRRLSCRRAIAAGGNAAECFWKTSVWCSAQE